jgi:molecular chaperone GrpE
MVADGKEKKWSSIPVHFFDEENDTETNQPEDAEDESGDLGSMNMQDEVGQSSLSGDRGEANDRQAGPLMAELLATRAELKRVEGERAEAQDRLARRQADFENYRKRTERERGEAYNRVVGDVVHKLLPVIDNLRRALDAERSKEANESEEFRHFLHGVELINKQLNEVLESLGLEAVPAMGERFDPHVHEAVVTEPTDEFEPDTVMQEIVRGYRLGEKLLRPAMVKVATQSGGKD